MKSISALYPSPRVATVNYKLFLLYNLSNRSVLLSSWCWSKFHFVENASLEAVNSAVEHYSQLDWLNDYSKRRPSLPLVLTRFDHQVLSFCNPFAQFDDKSKNVAGSINQNQFSRAQLFDRTDKIILSGLYASTLFVDSSLWKHDECSCSKWSSSSFISSHLWISQLIRSRNFDDTGWFVPMSLTMRYKHQTADDRSDMNAWTFLIYRSWLSLIIFPGANDSMIHMMDSSSLLGSWIVMIMITNFPSIHYTLFKYIVWIIYCFDVYWSPFRGMNYGRIRQFFHVRMDDWLMECIWLMI